MDKIAFIEEYIGKCDIVITNNDIDEAKKLQKEIVRTFSSEIGNIHSGLSNYRPFIAGVGKKTNPQYGSGNLSADYLEDIGLLRQKLINYICNIEEERSKREHELELARLKQPLVSAHAEANPVQNQSVIVRVTLEQTLKLIDDISEDNLSSADKKALKEQLYSLEGIKTTNDKNELWNKAKEILKFIADKGADAAIAALPLIMSGLLKN
ncbi:MAG: hypothetical protein FWF19_01215 [Euryarchaeota archaeon]|nr:hypothetical protein [Euryarchaeota archaeon]